MTLDEVLDDLLGPDRHREGDLDVQLVEALKESLRRRERNSQLGGAVVQALRDRGWSFRRIEREAGIPVGTAHRWSKIPGDDE